MRDGYLLATIKRLTLLRYQIDLGISRFFLRRRGEPHYSLHGSCNDCGRCCENPTIRAPMPIIYFKLTRYIFLGWQRRVNGFIHIATNRKLRLITFKCTHWQSDQQRCDSYHTRPGMCRDYPYNLLFAARPNFFLECGYRPLDLQSAGMVEALQNSGLSTEEVDKIRDALYLPEPEPIEGKKNSEHEGNLSSACPNGAKARQAPEQSIRKGTSV